MILLFLHKNQRFAFCIALFLIYGSLLCQPTYFQQEVNYTMRVRLNDQAHSLSAFQTIQYINNADKALDVIYFHLWPNAYKDQTTALAHQFLEQGKTDFYFSKAEERGYMDSLDFKVNGQAISWQLDKSDPDICKLTLNQLLLPGDTITITTPFFVKIPDAKFSRLGHTGQAYFITQWYPKPAVFDLQGWHPMPYLDQGEFFSEFGSFDVSITLPENYQLAATGDRIDADEEETQLNQKVIETLKRLNQKDYQEDNMDFPPSSPRLKTVRFKQFRVHDFAWFADKRFNVIHDQVELPLDARKVDTWIFFTNKNFKLWENAITYVNEATLFYSYLNGDYPYNNVTAVDGTIMAGGGMEYPNITVIGDMANPIDLDITIAHEVGHNWFYGVLGSNERDYPFLDEGINSFYEMRYARGKYPARKLSSYINRDSTFRLFGLNKTPFWKEKELIYYISMRAHTDQPINLPAPDFTAFNYGSIVYDKTAVVLDYLMDYMGEQSFDKAMKFYYEQSRFKHPSPDDFIKTLSYFSGLDVGWLVNHFLNSTDHIDYKIKRVKQNEDGSFTLKVKNKTGVVGPITIYAFKDNKPVGLVWYNGFEKSRVLGFPVAEVDYFKLDGLDKMPDINRRNNYIRAQGIFKKRKPLQLNLITKLENPQKTQVNYIPILGANFYNGFTLGAAIYNYGFYQNRFEYVVAPMFAFNTKTPVGFAELNYNFYPKKRIQQLTLGVKGKTFAYDYFDTKALNELSGTNYSNLYLNYYKIVPSIQLEFKKRKATSNVQQVMTYSNVNLLIDSLVNPSLANYQSSGPHKKTVYSFVNVLNYQYINKRAIDPFDVKANLQHTASMAKFTASLLYKITLTKKYFMEFRAFAGYFVAGNLSERSYYSFRTSGYQGSDDYLFDNNFAARNQRSGIGYSQFAEMDGALKIPVLFGYASRWLTALNLKSPRIFGLPLKVFADVATSDASGLLKDKWLWDAGINVSLITGLVEVYIPLAYSQDIRTVLDLNNVLFINRIRFTFNLQKLKPKDFIKNRLTE